MRHYNVTPRRNLWRSIRILRRFSQADLIVTAEVSSRTVSRYLNALIKTGYVRRHRVGLKIHYQLLRDTGPRPPLVDDTKLTDQNTGEVYDLA